MRLLGTVLFACLSFVVPVSAGNVLFDFEDRENTWNPGGLLGQLTSYTYTKGDVTMTIVRDFGAPFDIVGNTASPEYQTKPDEWGLRSLDGFASLCNCGFLLNFSHPLRDFSVMIGDYSGDLDELQVIGYSGLNGTGDVLATAGGWLFPSNCGEFPYETLILPTIEDSGSPHYRSVYIKGGPVDALSGQIGSHSVYIDNVDVYAVPEPGTTALAASALASVALFRRRRA